MMILDLQGTLPPALVVSLAGDLKLEVLNLPLVKERRMPKVLRARLPKLTLATHFSTKNYQS